MAGQSLQLPMPGEPRMAWSSTPVCGLGCLRSGLEPACYIPLTVVDSTLLGLFDKRVGSPDGECGVSPGASLWVVPLHGPGCSDLVCRHCRGVSLPDVSGVTRVVSLLNQSVTADAALLVDMSDSTLFYMLCAVLTRPTAFYWSCSPQGRALGLGFI